MIIPVGLIVDLIERLLKRPNFDAEPTPEIRFHLLQMVRTSAGRVGASAIKEFGSGFAMMFDDVRVGLKFLVADRAIHKITWTTSAMPPGIPSFTIEKRGLLSFAQRRVPRGTVPILEPIYTVKSNDPDAMHLLWNQDMCDLLGRVSAKAIVTSDGRSFDVVCATTGHPDVLDAGVKLCLAIARSDVYAAKLLRELPNATFVEQQLPYVVIPGPGAIRVGFFREKELVVTRARAAIGEVSEEVAAGAQRVGATTAIENGELVLSWPTAVRDRQVLLEAVELLRGAANPRQGVFR